MIIIGLGANLDGPYGDARTCLSLCPSWFAEKGLYMTACSSIWTSAPVPISDQPWYFNAVCAVETDLNPNDILTALHDIEYQAGRVRTERNAARILDLDILIYHDEAIEAPHLSIPHQYLQDRAFVLYPLQEIAPDWVHPVLDKSVEKMIEDMPEGQDIQQIEESKFFIPHCG